MASDTVENAIRGLVENDRITVNHRGRRASNLYRLIEKTGERSLGSIKEQESGSSVLDARTPKRVAL
jgi:hypothetical protein